jgi:hypothetical protein
MIEGGGPRLFVIAGMPRTATTSLYHILGAHPALFQPFRKEVASFLFSHHRGAGWFRGVYREMRPEQFGLDVTPEYFFSSVAIARLGEWAPDARVAIGVRDPDELAVSLYREYARRRFGMPPFDAFLEEFVAERDGEVLRFSLARGDIGRMLGEWRAALGDRLLLYDFRLFQRDPLCVLRGIETFLGIPRHFTADTFQNLHLNSDGRRNSRLVSYLLGRESLIAALHRALPAPLLTRLARAFYVASARRPAPVPPPTTVRAIPALAGDRAIVAALFARGGLVLGSGAPLRGVTDIAT